MVDMDVKYGRGQNKDEVKCDSSYSMLNAYYPLSYDFASGSEIKPCKNIDKPLVVYRFTGNVMTSIPTLST